MERTIQQSTLFSNHAVHTYLCTYLMTNVNMAARERTELKGGPRTHVNIVWPTFIVNQIQIRAMRILVDQIFIQIIEIRLYVFFYYITSFIIYFCFVLQMLFLIQDQFDWMANYIYFIFDQNMMIRSMSFDSKHLLGSQNKVELIVSGKQINKMNLFQTSRTKFYEKSNQRQSNQNKTVALYKVIKKKLALTHFHHSSLFSKLLKTFLKTTLVVFICGFPFLSTINT